MEDYKDIIDRLKPRRDFTASEELRNRINSTLNSYTKKRRPLRWLWYAGISCVTAAVLLLFLIPTRISAKEILSETIKILNDTRDIEMTVEIRTHPMENFKYIDLSADFVTHKISIVKSDSAISWRIDKGGRVAIGNNEVIYNWIDQLHIGWQTNNSNPKELLGELAILLTPEKILENELHNCINNSEAHYNLEHRDKYIILTIHTQAQGDFINPYILNSSITESENIRQYVIDADTKHLKSASVSIINGKKETLVLRISNIVYNKPQNNIINRPSDVRFIDISNNSVQGLRGLTSTEAASAFLNALESWDVSIIDNVMDENLKIAMYEHDLKGSVLISIGNSFNSGNEGITFVPYVLRLPNGAVKRHNLALQKNSQGGWIIVGGL